MAKSLFQQAKFIKSAPSIGRLPTDQGKEIAFVGRSNAGKSSVLNALTGNSKLARKSKTPGRTQLLNAFELTPSIRLVDLPGYGYAKISTKQQKEISRMIGNYLAYRDSLVGLVVIMDIRHPLKDDDRDVLNWSLGEGLRSLILLNKADKLSRGAANNTKFQIQKELESFGNLATVQTFSATNMTGVPEARATLSSWL